MNQTSQSRSFISQHGETIGLWVDGFGRKMWVLLGLFLFSIHSLILVLANVGVLLHLVRLGKDIVEVSLWVRIPCVIGILASPYILFVAWHLFENSVYHIGKLVDEVLDEWFD